MNIDALCDVWHLKCEDSTATLSGSNGHVCKGIPALMGKASPMLTPTIDPEPPLKSAVIKQPYEKVCSALFKLRNYFSSDGMQIHYKAFVGIAPVGGEPQ